MKRLFVIIVFFLVTSVYAQENNFWRKVNDLLTKVKNIDTTYIYQPKQGFTFGLFSSLQQVGFDTKFKFDYLNEEGTPMPGISNYHLDENPCPKIGFELGYGKFVLGYGFEVGPKRTYKTRTFGLNILGQNWGLHSNYFKFNSTFRAHIAVGNAGDPHHFEEDIFSVEPAEMTYLSIDGYYLFNNKRFAYPATYKAGLVQRKTAGAWIVTGRYMQGSLFNPPQFSDDNYYVLDGYSTMQISVGGGYSVNFVCWHIDPIAPHDKGLCNFTINLTLMPVFTAFNYLKTTSYQYNEEGEPIKDNLFNIFSYPMPNFIGSSAFSLTLDRFFFSTQFSYNWFYFLSAQSVNPYALPNSPNLENLTYNSSFNNWNLKLLFTYKF
jgi:hypothetical protein